MQQAIRTQGKQNAHVSFLGVSTAEINEEKKKIRLIGESNPEKQIIRTGMTESSNQIQQNPEADDKWETSSIEEAEL